MKIKNVHRKLTKKQKMEHKREIVLSLSIIVMLFMFLAFMLFSNFFVLEKNISGLGYLADFKSNEVKYENGKFILNMVPGRSSEIKVHVDGPVERFPIMLSGNGEDVSIEVGEGKPLIAYGTFEGNIVNMRMFPEKKNITFNDSIKLTFPRASIYSASIMLEDDVEYGKPLNWDMVGINSYAVVPGLNNIKNKIELTCKPDLCFSELSIESDESGSVLISDLKISYVIERLDYSYEVDTYCKAYPCEVPIKVSSLTEGVMALDIPQVLKVGEEALIIEEPSAIEEKSSKESIVGENQFLLQVFMIVILIGLLATLFVSRLNNSYE